MERHGDAAEAPRRDHRRLALDEALERFAAPSQPVRQTLSQRQLRPVGQHAFADRQGAGATAAQSSHLRQVPVSIEALAASYRGEEAGNRGGIRPDAAG